nr:MAG TPA: hypothetical protein [Bacteriophage sp.]
MHSGYFSTTSFTQVGVSDIVTMWSPIIIAFIV